MFATATLLLLAWHCVQWLIATATHMLPMSACTIKCHTDVGWSTCGRCHRQVCCHDVHRRHVHTSHSRRPWQRWASFKTGICSYKVHATLRTLHTWQAGYLLSVQLVKRTLHMLGAEHLRPCACYANRYQVVGRSNAVPSSAISSLYMPILGRMQT